MPLYKKRRANKMKVSLKEKISYALGDAGCNFVWTTVGSFLTIYYTNSVGIAPAAVATLMLLTRLLDGVSDLVMGSVIDRTNTKWGKARPWVLWTAPLMGIGLVLLFSVPASLPSGAQLVYAYITYILMAAVIYTACNLAYTTLLSLMTDDPEVRSTVSSIRFFAVMIAVLVISYGTNPLVAKIGWTGTAAVFGVAGCLLLLVCFFGTRERITEAAAETTEPSEKLSVGKSFLLLSKNKYFILVALLFVINYIVASATSGSGVYYATYVLGDANLFGSLVLFGMVPSMFAVIFLPKITEKLGKWKTLMGGYILQIIAFAIIGLAPTNLPVLFAALFLKSVASTPSMAIMFAVVADVVDYGELKTGKRIDGLTYSAVSFGMKVGTGLGSAVIGWALALGNFDGLAATQPDSAITSIIALYSYIPAILSVLGAIVMYMTNVDKAIAELKAKQ
jgi:GPH family glycoside/pentoside/hexuronide:cation symporter